MSSSWERGVVRTTTAGGHVPNEPTERRTRATRDAHRSASTCEAADVPRSGVAGLRNSRFGRVTRTVVGSGVVRYASGSIKRAQRSPDRVDSQPPRSPHRLNRDSWPRRPFYDADRRRLKIEPWTRRRGRAHNGGGATTRRLRGPVDRCRANGGRHDDSASGGVRRASRHRRPTARRAENLNFPGTEPP